MCVYCQFLKNSFSAELQKGPNTKLTNQRDNVNRGISFCHPTEKIYHGNTKSEEFVETCFGENEPNTRLAFYRKVNN
jgi:hypothetical protein